jgi:glycosyltransferase involved in cell wall biosynthesis
MSNIFKRLNGVELDVIGINHDGRPDYDRERFPGRVWPARSIAGKYPIDVYGMQKLIDRIEQDDYDILFILNDPFVVDKVMPEILKSRVTKLPSKRFDIVFYYPLDTTPLVSWIRESVAHADCPVAYTDFGYKRSIMAVPELENKLKIIPHGIDTHDFHPIPPDDQRVISMRNQLTHGRDTTLLLNVNRNTPRKDIHRSLMVLSKLKERGENVMMYLHCSPRDLGGDFTIIGQWLGLQEHVDYVYPHDLDPVYGYSVEDLNLIYNASDILINTSLGEGWGYSITEAMATCTPVVAPSHSSLTEIVGQRGSLVKAGVTDSEWIVLPGDNMVLRPLTNVEEMATQIQWVMRSPNLVQERTQKAFEWVNELNWDLLVEKQWKPILQKDTHGNHTFH